MTLGIPAHLRPLPARSDSRDQAARIDRIGQGGPFGHPPDDDVNDDGTSPVLLFRQSPGA